METIRLSPWHNSSSIKILALRLLIYSNDFTVFFFSSFLLFDEPGDVIDEDPEDAIDVDDDVVAADDDEDFLTLLTSRSSSPSASLSRTLDFVACRSVEICNNKTFLF